jgi:hypothetical protein
VKKEQLREKLEYLKKTIEEIESAFLHGERNENEDF